MLYTVFSREPVLRIITFLLTEGFSDDIQKSSFGCNVLMHVVVPLLVYTEGEIHGGVVLLYGHLYVHEGGGRKFRRHA